METLKKEILTNMRPAAIKKQFVIKEKQLKQIRRYTLTLCIFSLSLFSENKVFALDCGHFASFTCLGPSSQYSGNFNPQTGYGGFGGGNCKARRTPVVFIHGNGDTAIGWDSPAVGKIQNLEQGPSEYYPPVKNSVYKEFKAQGYNDCELFGVSYLSSVERLYPQGNYNQREKYRILIDFIQAVKNYTGYDQVDIVAHSIGVSMIMAALKAHDQWPSVRRFVNISGGIRGLNSCLYVGPANPSVLTCASENIFDPYMFGFFPYYNRWMGDSNEFSLRQAPHWQNAVQFYTLMAGNNDELHCSTLQGWNNCFSGPLFESYSNVKAQLNVGTGSSALVSNFNFTKWCNPLNFIWGGDIDGIGHLKSKINTGQIIHSFLNGDCLGLNCKGSYVGGPVSDTEK